MFFSPVEFDCRYTANPKLQTRSQSFPVGEEQTGTSEGSGDERNGNDWDRVCPSYISNTYHVNLC